MEHSLEFARARRRDVREGGRWSFWQRAKNAFILRLVRGALWAADRTPARALLRLGRSLGWSLYWLAPRLRARARARAAACFDRARAHALVRNSFVHMGENLCLSLLLRRPGIAPSDFVSLDATTENTLCEAVAAGRGVVFVSAHLGPFELLAARVAELGVRPAVVVRESYDPRLDACVDAHRTSHGLEVIHRGKPGAAARILRALRQGKPVGFLVDIESRVPSVRHDFLGRPSLIPLGPQRLCQLTGADLVVGTLRRRLGPGLGRATSTLPHFDLTITRVPSAGEDELTYRVVRLVERAILRNPEDWPWLA
ncbi:MAG TPA: lysophospholipid acyltransferase family protein [Polyangiaceae bacterium]